MEITLIIGIPVSVVLVIAGSFIYLWGRYWKVFTSRIIVALACFLLCVLGICLIVQGPVEIQAKKYIVAMSIALTIYIIAFVFNLIQLLVAYEYVKKMKSESEIRLAMKRRDREEGEK